MNIQTIQLTGVPKGICTLHDTSGQIRQASLKAVGMALLGAAVEGGETLASVEWTDMLASNGVAFGYDGRAKVTVAVLPSKPRPVRLYSTAGWRDASATFPPMLAVLRILAGRFQSARLYMVKPAALPLLSMSSDGVLAAFPYGNVYAGTGSICWGSVPTADIRSIHDFESLFFGSGFNGDLYDTTRAPAGGLNAAVTRDPILPALADTAFTIHMRNSHRLD